MLFRSDAPKDITEAPLVDMAEFEAAATNQPEVAMGQVFDDAPVDEIYSAQASVNFWDVVQGNSANVGANVDSDHAATQQHQPEPPPQAPSVYDQAVSELDNSHNASDGHHFNIDTLNDILNPTFEMYDI